MEPVKGGLKICKNGRGHCPLINIAAMPIHGKHLQIFFARTAKALRLSLGIKHRAFKVYQVCSNDDH